MRLSVIILAVVNAAACATVSGPPPSRADGPSEAVLRARAAELMTACWSQVGDSRARVALTFTREDGKLADVGFSTSGGASNAVGRCIQHLAWTFPWEGYFPDAMELAPPLVRPSGWTYLAHLAMQNERVGEERGLRDPAPLVRACLEAGGGLRPGLRFRVQPLPLKVTAFVERMSVSDPEDVHTEAEPVLTEAGRCVTAVLAATTYPSSRALELDFSDLQVAPAAAPRAEVSQYFTPTIGEVPDGRVDPSVVQELMGVAHPEIAQCWDRAIARRSGLSGARTVRMRVLPDGKVAFAQVAFNQSNTPDEASDYVLDRCLISAVSKLTFPPPSGGTADVTYSWVFEHR